MVDLEVNSMTSTNAIVQAIYQILETLPPEKQQEVLNFAELLQMALNSQTRKK